MKDERAGRCEWCDEPVRADDPVAECNVLMHHECGMRAILGGANHLLKLCTCCGGTLPPDPPELTRREAARLAQKVFYWVRELQTLFDNPRAGKKS